MTWSCQFFPAVAGSSWQEPHVVLLLLSVSGLYYLSFVQSQLLLCKRACPKFNTITRKEKRLKYYWPSDVHAISYPHRGTPFWYVAVFQNDFAFSGKPLIFSTRWAITYEWWRCALEACDVTKYGRHLGRHLEFYQELEVRLKSSLRTEDVSRGGTSAIQRQKFHSDDAKPVQNPVRCANWSTE